MPDYILALLVISLVFIIKPKRYSKIWKQKKKDKK